MTGDVELDEGEDFNQFEKVSSWKTFGATMFISVFAFLGLTLIHVSVLLLLMKYDWACPAILVFPRLQLIALMAIAPGVTWASAVLLARVVHSLVHSLDLKGGLNRGVNVVGGGVYCQTIGRERRL